MLHVIINEQLYDKAFVEQWCHGFEELKVRVQEYPPARVADICCCSAEELARAARIFATAESACVSVGNGINQHHNSVQVHRAINILIAITGNIDVPGGHLLPGCVESGNCKGLKGYRGNEYILRYGAPQLPDDVRAKALGASHFPLWVGPSAMMPVAIHNPTLQNALLGIGTEGPIRALYITGMNPLVTYPGATKMYEGLQQLDFLAVASHSMTPTVELADVVLPKKHWYEKEEVVLDIYGHCLTLTRKIFEPPGEAKEDLEICYSICDKAVQRGYIERNPILWKNLDELNAWRLEMTGHTMEEVRDKGYIRFEVFYKEYETRGKFFMPTGKVELYSTILAKHGYDPLPYHKLPPAHEATSPEIVKRFPLLFGTARNKVYQHSRFRDTVWSRRARPYPRLEIHPDTASSRGIADGQWVWIETHHGRIRMMAEVAPNIHPRFVNGEMGWWYPEKISPGHGAFDSNPNVIITYDSPDEPVMGVPPLKGVPCQVYPADEPVASGDPIENLKRAWDSYYSRLPAISGDAVFGEIERARETEAK